MALCQFKVPLQVLSLKGIAKIQLFPDPYEICLCIYMAIMVSSIAL